MYKAQLQQAQQEKAELQKQLAEADAGFARELAAKLELQEQGPRVQVSHATTTIEVLASSQSMQSAARVKNQSCVLAETDGRHGLNARVNSHAPSHQHGLALALRHSHFSCTQMLR